jgi:hypothetical protein
MTRNPFGETIMPGSRSIDNGKGDASETTHNKFLGKCFYLPISHSSSQ